MFRQIETEILGEFRYVVLMPSDVIHPALAGGVAVTIGGQELVLLPGGGAWLPGPNLLLVADLHLGKAATFRAHSIGVPTGPDQSTLDALASMIDRTGAAEVMFLGDLFHAKSSLAASTIGPWEAFLANHTAVAFTLVEGNHDRSVGRLPRRWGVDLVTGHLNVGEITLCHEPVMPWEPSRLLIGGHLHPGHEVVAGGQRSGKLPCFWHSRGCLVLPAVGRFTGTARVRVRRGDRVWLCVEDRVIEVSV